MSKNRNMFVELNKSVNSNVAFGDYSKVLVNDKDKILFHAKNNSHQFISNVFYVPNIKSNIFSLG